MSSCKFDGGKCKGPTHAKASLRHDEIDKESRAIAKKGNPDIDLEMSQYNIELTGMTYQQKANKYDARIKELDDTTNTNRRKDRVTLQKIEIPVPKDLDEDDYIDWFRDVEKILVTKYGSKNYISGAIHADEQHEYLDPKTDEYVVSRVHAHFGFVPEINGKLNAKTMTLRKNMKALNRDVQAMTQQKYGCKFMDGSKQKSEATVDELKNTSRMAEIGDREQQIEIEWNTINREKAILKTAKNDFEKNKAKFLQDAKAYKKRVVSEVQADSEAIKQDAQEYRLKWQKRLETANTTSDAYLKYQSRWMQTHGYSQQCLNDYDEYLDLQHPSLNICQPDKDFCF